MYKFIQNWMKNIDKAEIDKNVNGRKCAIFYGGGHDKESDELISDLENLGIYISRSLYNVCEIKECERTEWYILVAVLGIDEEVLKCLHGRGYQSIEDYLYLYHDIRISGIEGYYRDLYHNEIIAEKPIKKCNIRFKGWNSRLYIHSKVNLTPECEINIGSDCTVVIGEAVQIGESSIRCEDGCTIAIGDGCHLAKGKMVSRNKIEIGKRCIINEGFIIICEEKTEISIGDDCLVSSNVHMRSGNGHSLFMKDKQENISQRAKHIVIGEHVWIGQDVTILYNTKLGNNCVVGAKSLVKREHEAGCLLYGVPAKTVERNVDWDIRNISYEEYMEQ